MTDFLECKKCGNKTFGIELENGKPYRFICNKCATFHKTDGSLAPIIEVRF